MPVADRHRRNQPGGPDAGAEEGASGGRAAARRPGRGQIGLVGGGDIEGALVKSGGLGFEGVDLELVDVTGKVVGTARTDFDGFFLFERIAYGDYACAWPRIRPRPPRSRASSGLRIKVTPDKSIVRLGAIAVRPLPVLASAGPITRRSLRFPEVRRARRWCGRENSNFHGLSATATSRLRVYQFRHDRTS